MLIINVNASTMYRNRLQYSKENIAIHPIEIPNSKYEEAASFALNLSFSIVTSVSEPHAIHFLLRVQNLGMKNHFLTLSVNI